MEAALLMVTLSEMTKTMPIVFNIFIGVL